MKKTVRKRKIPLRPSLWVLSRAPCNKRQMNKRETNTSLLTCIYTGETQGKLINSQSALEFGIKYHPKRGKRGRGRPASQGRLDRGALRKQEESMLVCDKVCLGMVSLLVSSPAMRVTLP